MFGPFYRPDPPHIVRRIVESGELWGMSPRNVFRSDTPKVKAYSGHLPSGIVGFEFETEVEPDRGCVPGKPTWSNGPKRKGIVVEGEYAKIKVTVLKTVLS
jgi:hypothetical protein